MSHAACRVIFDPQLLNRVLPGAPGVTPSARMTVDEIRAERPPL